MIAPCPTRAEAADAVLGRLAQIVGVKHVVTDTLELAPHLVEPRELFKGRARAMVRPATTAEVSRVMVLCNETGLPVVPQGGNTGLVGGQTPHETGDEIILSLTRLDRLREADPATNTLTVEAGMTLTRVHDEAARIDRMFPLSLASEGSCTIGGNLATNAGGTAVLAYGNARDLVLGLEAVLADGRVLSNLSKLKKDNTGYDLKHLFMGSEGTLGVITAAVLKLFPRPRAIETAFVGLADPAAALKLLELALDSAGASVTAFELMPRIGLDMVLRHAPGTRDPLAGKHAWYVLLELSAQAEHGLLEALGSLLENAMSRDIIDDAAVATSLDQREAFWKLRDMQSEVQGREGGSIKQDVSVPLALVPRFIADAEGAVGARIPGARMVAFGHLGDGNIHCNVSQPVGADKATFLTRWAEVNAIVHAVVTRLGGSISAEHGIGRLKRNLLPAVKDPVALDVMRALKATLDPKGILNPGKVL
ncbi:MAG: FAD-binding oxidoreductase [Methylobacteriaceae bacterium]|nr:FAD-binding oxidoreductase [Methylobacteriaceae bacterium]